MAKYGEKLSGYSDSVPISRETGYLYYVGTDGFVWRSPQRRKKKVQE